MIAQNNVHELGLGNPEFIGCPFDEFLVVVGDDELLVFAWECPTAYAAVQRTPSTGITLDIVALLAERLPIAKVIRATTGPRDFVIRAKLHIWLLHPARGTPVVVLLQKPFPFGLAQLRSWLAFLAYIQILQLITGPLFPDRRETFFALQFSHAPENVLIWRLAVLVAESIYGATNLLFGQHWPWDAVSWRPKCSQDNGVVALIRRACGNEPSFSPSKPLLPPFLRFIGLNPRSEEKALAGSGFNHFAVRL